MNEIDREALRAEHQQNCRRCTNHHECPYVLLLDSTDAQLAALRDERDRARNVIEQVVTDCTWAANMHEFDLDGRGYKNFAERIGLALRQLIESEEGQ